MPEEIKTCQGQVYDRKTGRNKYCDRLLYDDKHCICHSEDPHKDINQFKDEVRKQLNREDCHDFSSFAFPENYSFKDTSLKHNVYFRDAKFAGGTEFTYAKFGGKVNFEFADFGGKVNFEFADFGGKVNFTYAKFAGEANFGCAEFTDYATFFLTKFGGDAHFESTMFKKRAIFNLVKLNEKAIVRFDGEENELDKSVFQDTADFSQITILKDATIVFRKIDLSRCFFLETDVTKVDFSDVTWAYIGGIGKWFKTKVVYDAIKNGNEDKDGNYDYRLIAQLYRRLQINYIDNCHYSQAGDFHIGEQEAVRKSKGKLGQYLCTNMLYKMTSIYGESFVRPLLWLVVILLLFPAIFLYTGLDVATPPQHVSKIENNVNYEFSVNPSNAFLFNVDYWNSFGINLSFISFDRTEIKTRLHSQYQITLVHFERLCVITLVSFFILALRRSYKRKI
ncbi:MAG: pentapeptide repeat-containing protein [candidate division Zixibacteria bacterium]|nr:pentapeptide repeat-containing protein [candidate division Zixibacteria bacterium]